MSTDPNPEAPGATAPNAANRVLGDLELELAGTRRILERVPVASFSWKPHQKSMSLGHLATHLANLPRWGVMTLQTDEMDLATVPPDTEGPPDRDVLLRRFDENAAAFRAALAEADAPVLGAAWTLRVGDRVVMTQPRTAVLRSMVISHMIHHRAQLGVYLRLLDVPLPNIYGPTADQPL